jgi:EAL domain-containing protein (putative c-di-GMP-specific phosphodiesterase class I)
MEQGKPLMASDSPLVDFDAVCQKVRAAVEPARTHAVSLHDETGDVLWLSESSMGPDEHNAVLEAAEAFTNPSAAPVLAFDLGDARSAVMIRAINARHVVVGVVMIVMDSRIVAQGPPKLMTPKMQRALVLFAGMRPDRRPAPAELPPVTVPPPAAHPPKATAPAPTAARSATGTTIKARVPTPPPSANINRNSDTQTSSLSATMPFSAGPRSIAAQVQQIVSRTPARPSSAPPPSSSVPRPSTHDVANPNRGARGGGGAAIASPSVQSAGLQSPSVHSANVQSAAVQSPSRANIPNAANLGSIEPIELTLPAEFSEKSQAKNGVTPEIDRLHAALRKSPIALHIQRLVPLSKGSQLRRYEVLLRSGSEASPNAAPHAMLKAAVDNGLGSMIDRRVLTELISWLIRHPESCQAHEVMFSVNLTSTALHDEHFIKFVELCLAKSSLPKATIAFEVDASTAMTLADKVSGVAEALQRLGCPLILDDFALRTECFELLRLPGVRYVKLSPDMTTKMRTDKVSQAAITGVVQMARVLGMHTVAKRTETAAEQEWLTALGVDFVQSHAISPPVSIDSLLQPANGKI